MRYRIFVLVIFFALKTSFASSLPDYPFVHVSGSASTLLPPDIGEFDFEINTMGANADVAYLEAQEISNTIFLLAKENNIKNSDIEAYDYRKEILKTESPVTKQLEVSYQILRRFQIRVRDLRSWEAVIRPILSKNNVGHYSSSFDRADRNAVEENLIKEASKQATHNAVVLAQSFGRKLLAAKAISKTKLKNVGLAFELAIGAEQFGSVSEKEVSDERNFNVPSTLFFGQNVDVIFSIK